MRVKKLLTKDSRALDATEQAMVDALYRLHLRAPGKIVPGKIVNILRLAEVSTEQLNRVIEQYKVHFGHKPPVTPVSPPAGGGA